MAFLRSDSSEFSNLIGSSFKLSTYSAYSGWVKDGWRNATSLTPLPVAQSVSDLAAATFSAAQIQPNPPQYAVVTGTSNDDPLNGTNVDDQIFGLAGDDQIYGFGGNDGLYGGDGNDFLEGGTGINQIYGDAGIDTVSYKNSTGNVTVNLHYTTANAIAHGGAYANDSIYDVENIEGSNFNDYLNGSSTDNTIWGLSGNDTISGREGNDIVYGGDGDDIIYGSIGDDVLYSGNGFDQLYGGQGNDTLYGVDGADSLNGDHGNDILHTGGMKLASANLIDGGLGIDTLYFGSVTEALRIDLPSGVAYYLANSPYFDSGPNLEIFRIDIFHISDFSDVFVGDDKDNVVWGEGGDDLLDGNSGIDTAAFSGDRANYVVTRLSNTQLLVSDSRTQAQINSDAGGNGVSDGTDTVTNFELFQFKDGTYTFAELEAGANWAPTGSVSITGTQSQGSTLSVSSTLADQNGIGVFSYQWLRDGVDIAGATSATYKPVQADVGKKVSVRVSYTDNAGYKEAVTSAETGPIANTDDPGSGTVTISGVLAEDQTLTANPALSDPDVIDPNSFTYQWQRGGVDISGATGKTYTTTDFDVGKALTVTVSYTDGFGGTGSKTSATTSAISNVNDAPVGQPTISTPGGLTVGATIVALKDGISDADGVNASTFTYQWLRDGVAISGATSKTYTLSNADAGKKMSVIVKYTDNQQTKETVTSAETTAVSVPNSPPNTSGVSVTGKAEVGETLTIDASGLTDPNGVPSTSGFSFEWLRDGVKILSAAGTSYKLTAQDLDAKIDVRILYTDGAGYSESATVQAATKVSPNFDDPVKGSVRIEGLRQEDRVLTAKHSLYDPDIIDQASFTYVWKRDGQNISGATGETYKTTDADVGAKLSVEVFYKDSFGRTGSKASIETIAIRNVNDAPTGAPTVVAPGGLGVGKTLTADISQIADADGTIGSVFTYQWLRDGKTISGATGKSYVLADKDAGKKMSVVVRYTDNQNTQEKVVSAETASVPESNKHPNPRDVVVKGATEVGKTLTVDVSNLDDPNGNPAPGGYSFKWLRDGEKIPNATGSSYVLTAADEDKKITGRVLYTDQAGYSESVPFSVKGKIDPPNSPADGRPDVNGFAQVGKTLTADISGLDDANGFNPKAMSYQWYRDGTKITGETGKTYKLTKADADHKIQVRVKFKDNDGFKEQKFSKPTKLIDDGNDRPTGAVKIKGKLKEDATLKAITNTLSDPDGPNKLKFAYQWYRDDDVVIKGEKGKTYTLTKKDVGSTIKVKVTYKDAFGTKETKLSQKTGLISGDSKGNDTSEKWTGGASNDKYFALGGSDFLKGKAGNDHLYGGVGDDFLFGDEGDDFVVGGAGNDKLIGGPGNDRLTGGKGADWFYYDGGTDVIKDFDPNIDVLVIEYSSYESVGRLLQDFRGVVNGDSIFDFKDGNTLKLLGVDGAANLAPKNLKLNDKYPKTSDWENNLERPFNGLHDSETSAPSQDPIDILQHDDDPVSGFANIEAFQDIL